MGQSISARCTNLSTVPAAATPPRQAGLPLPVRPSRRITQRMASTSAATAKLFADLVYQHYNQAISVLNPLLGPQSPTQP